MPVVVDFATVGSLFVKRGDRKAGFYSVEIGLTAIPRLSENDRLSAIGMIQAGMLHRAIATQFCVHINTIQALWRRFQQFGIVRDRRRAGRPRMTSRQQDNHIRLVHLRNPFQTASDVTAAGQSHPTGAPQESLPNGK